MKSSTLGGSIVLKLLLRSTVVRLVLMLSVVAPARGLPSSSSSAKLNPNYKFHFEIQSWSRTCIADTQPEELAEALKCSLAEAYLSPEYVAIEVMLPSHPGEAKSASSRFGSNNNNEKLRGAIKIFAIHPNESSPWPPYFQIQLETFAPHRVFCTQSVKAKENMSFPTFTCSANIVENQSIRQIGFNIIQR